MHPDRAMEIIRGITPWGQTEEVLLEQALGRALAGPVASPIDSPPFTKSAMDGYAVRDADAAAGPPAWRLRGTVAAGDRSAAPLGPGECVKIMTGAMLPPGADRVVRLELTEERDGRVRLTAPETSRNVIERGENLKAGEVVLEPRLLAPQDIGVLAASGVARVRVAVPPRVGVLCTGSELREPGEPLRAGEIYNSNGPQLAAQVALLRCPVRYRGIAVDEPAALSAAVRSALAECDVLLLSGGVSMGEFDYVPRVLRELGAEVLFHGLEVKPGKPTLLARLPGGKDAARRCGPLPAERPASDTSSGAAAANDRYIFGLPGNPVTVFVIFELFVRPLLLRRMGLEDRPRLLRLRLAETVRRRQADRVEYRPVRLEGGQILPLDYHGSAHLNALSGANGLIRLEQGVHALEAGEEIDARPI